RSGGTASFTITVTNLGGVVLRNVHVTAPNSPDCSRGLGTLEVGEHKTFTCTRTNVMADYRSPATTEGTAPTGEKVRDVDTALVTTRFLPPARVVIVQSPKLQTLHNQGGKATFTITITNRSVDPLRNVKVSDPSSPDCNRTRANL